ncbi:MAG: hypothetical protein KDD09_00095 [Phaeodactylibacter sp.]|nr:hypothetical protein [Phaeodactylibacter sp.]
MNQRLEVISVTPDNIDTYGLFCVSSKLLEYHYISKTRFMHILKAT